MTQSGVNKSLNIGRLAAQASVGVDTIRFYERRGLLPEPTRTASGYRVYGDETIARVRFIRRAKDLGFSLDEIATLLRLQDQGGEKSAVRELTNRKLTQIDQKMDDLSRMRTVLKDLAGRCAGAGSVDCCPIIEALTREN